MCDRLPSRWQVRQFTKFTDSLQSIFDILCSVAADGAQVTTVSSYINLLNKIVNFQFMDP